MCVCVCVWVCVLWREDECGESSGLRCVWLRCVDEK